MFNKEYEEAYLQIWSKHVNNIQVLKLCLKHLLSLLCTQNCAMCEKVLQVIVHSIDANLVNTQALEHADRKNQNQTKHTGDRSDRSRQPVRPIGRRELREDLEPQAREGPRRSSKI